MVYHNIDDTPLIEKVAKARADRRRLLIASSLFAVIGLVAIGLGVAVAISHRHQAAKSKAQNSAESGVSDGDSSQTDSSDPSIFIHDPLLHKSFYGIAYTPEGSQLPDCGNSLESIIKDVQIMSQLTTRIRLYGADCNQSALVLEAIKQTKVDLSVYLAIYPSPVEPDAYTRQRDAIKTAIQTFGTDHISGVTVGNEVMLNYANEHAINDTDGPDMLLAVTNLKQQILDTRSMLSSLSLKKPLPVGTAEAGSFFSTDVLGSADYGMSNVHAWFANTTAQAAAGWTTNFFQNKNIAMADSLANKPKMYIAEVGWPTKSSDAGNANNGGSDASEASLQVVLDTFVCQANKNGTGYFFFEFFDEKWKDTTFGGIEGWWGLFSANRKLKSITIPDCAAP